MGENNPFPSKFFPKSHFLASKSHSQWQNSEQLFIPRIRFIILLTLTTTSKNYSAMTQRRFAKVLRKHRGQFRLYLKYQGKARGMISQLPIYYLPIGEWWRTLARTQSRTRHFLGDFIFLPRDILKESLQTKTVNDNVKLRRRTSYLAKRSFAKEKNLRRMIGTRP